MNGSKNYDAGIFARAAELRAQGQTWRQVGKALERGSGDALRKAFLRAGRVDPFVPPVPAVAHPKAPAAAKPASVEASPISSARMSLGPVMDDKALARASKLREQGLNWVQIGGAMGLHPSTLRKAFKRMSSDDAEAEANAEKAQPSTRAERAVLIRRALDAGMTQNAVARDLGVSRDTVASIMRQHGWQVVEGAAKRAMQEGNRKSLEKARAAKAGEAPPPALVVQKTKPAAIERSSASTAMDERVAMIRRGLDAGMTIGAMGREFRLCSKTIGRVMRAHGWTVSDEARKRAMLEGARKGAITTQAAHPSKKPAPLPPVKELAPSAPLSDDVVTPGADAVDAKLLRRMELAKTLLRHSEPTFELAQRCRLPLREVIRLNAEVREQRRAKAAGR